MEYFVTLAHSMSFTQAAQRLSVTQPALTAAIRQVEFLLGGRLFERSPHRLAPTDAGAAVLPLAERLLHSALGSFDDMARTIADGVRTVRIGLIPSAAAWLLPRLNELRAKQPSLRFALSDMTNTELVAAVAGGRIDIGIGVREEAVPERGLAYCDLFADDIVLVVRADDPLARRRRSVAWKRLAGRPLAVFASGNVNETLLRTSAALGLHLEPAFRMEYTEPIYALVRHHQALAVMPRLYTMSLRDAELVTLTLSSPRVHRTIAMLSVAGAERSPSAAACREWFARRASVSL
jgi:DNA-binding transcriptional LysR family regulator